MEEVKILIRRINQRYVSSEHVALTHTTSINADRFVLSWKKSLNAETADGRAVPSEGCPCRLKGCRSEIVGHRAACCSVPVVHQLSVLQRRFVLLTEVAFVGSDATN